MEDSEIVELFWLRDQSAVRETEAKYGGTLRRMAEHILKDRLDAEECLSDTLMKAWENTNKPTATLSGRTGTTTR